ncbi:MAG: hypothetical protein FJY77_03565 [Candidatus Altiarchaeales archaeon]|nr:hypothetical protein [Candidatus Altiarchaeales archaeon]
MNKDTCSKYALKMDLQSGIPGSPCTQDADCYQGLICLDFKCDIPTPSNLAKKIGFKLPGNCSSMQECSQYCSKPENSLDCLKFCEKFPSFCGGAGRLGAIETPKECQSCLDCKTKDCILGCTYNCYAYMPVETPDLESLKQNYTFERTYRIPIKAVWEPGPAYNRIGVTYFTDDYKNLGINTYHITAKYTHDQDNKLIHTVDHAIGAVADQETIANLIKAKKAGFQVVLVAHDLYDLFPNFNPNKNEKINPDSYLSQVETTALKWAEVAEEYNVEYFVPVNEFEYMLYENGYSAQEACEITNQLYNRIIPKVREIYKGRIYCRVGGMDAKFDCMNFTQCDLFGFTYGFATSDYKSAFEAEFKTGEEISKRDGKPYIMAEAFAFKNKIGLQEFIQYHKAGMEAYKTTAKNAVGYTFMGLIQNDPINKNDNSIIGTQLTEEYKNFYQSLGAEKQQKENKTQANPNQPVANTLAFYVM